MNSLIPFNFEQRELRTIRDAEGRPWFLAADVCNALGFSNPRKAVADHADAEDVTKRDTLTAGGKQTATFVNESGLYALIFGSRLPAAKRFKRWVTDEVLPKLRRDGSYSVGGYGPDMPYIAPRPPVLLTLAQIGERTGFTVGALRTRLFRGERPIPLFKVGREWRAESKDVDEWVWRMKNEGLAQQKRAITAPPLVVRKVAPARYAITGTAAPVADELHHSVDAIAATAQRQDRCWMCSAPNSFGMSLCERGLCSNCRTDTYGR